MVTRGFIMRNKRTQIHQFTSTWWCVIIPDVFRTHSTRADGIGMGVGKSIHRWGSVGVGDHRDVNSRGGGERGDGESGAYEGFGGDGLDEIRNRST